MMQKKRLFVAVASLFGLTCSAHAGWQVINLNPVGATSSSASGVRLGKVSGTVSTNNNITAVLWSNVLNTVVTTTLGSGYTSGTDGIEQSGGNSPPTAPPPGVWAGTPGSFTSLEPSPTPPPYVYQNTSIPYWFSVATGVFNGRQSGTSYFGIASKAVFWSDSPNSWVDLNGPNQISEAHGVGSDASNNLEEVGWIEDFAANTYLHATVWHDTAASAVDLNPAGADSSVLNAASFGKQAGYAVVVAGQPRHAGLWSGTAASFVDLNPTLSGVVDSTAYGVSNDAGTTATEAGVTDFIDGTSHASYWKGSAGSFEDLQSYLSPIYTNSGASGIWTNNAGISYVSGYATNSLTGNTEAILWVQTPSVPEPTSMIGIAAIAGLSFRRRI